MARIKARIHRTIKLGGKPKKKRGNPYRCPTCGKYTSRSIHR